MRILIFGAGVIGQTYGAKLFQHKADVTLFARGNNFQKLKKNGLTLTNKLTGEKIHCKIPVIQETHPPEPFDLIIVTVRLEQLSSSIPILEDFKTCENILFMLNNPKGLREITKHFHDQHIYSGFPGVSGMKTGNSIEYIQIKQQKTTLGYNKSNVETIKKIKDLFTRSGFPTVLEKKMEDWLIVHSVFISCASAAILKENGSSERLGNNKRAVQRMVKCVKEGLKACREQRIVIVPKNIKTIFLTMPEWFSVLYWEKAMRGDTGKLGIEPHAKVAKREMQVLAGQVLDVVHKSNIKTPNLDKLLQEFTG